MSFIESKAAQLLLDLPEAMLITSSSGEIIFFNDAVEKQSGFDRAEMLGAHVSALLPQSSRRKLDVVSWLARWADNPNPEQLRFLSLTGISKNGDERQYQVRVSRFVDGEENYFVVVLRDITEEHQQTLELRHAQLISNRIIAIGEDAVLSVDPDLKVCFWNQRAEQLFGYKEKEIIGQSMNILLPEAARSGHSKSVQAFSVDKAPSRMMGQRGEIMGLHKSGELLPLEASITKTYIGDKLIMSAQVRDISERKQAMETLLEREARFQAVFDHAVEAIALLDETGLILQINKAAKNLLPAGEDVNNKYLWQLGWWGTNDADEKSEAEQALQENVSNASLGNLFRSRAELVTSHGVVELDFSLIPVTADDNNEVKYIIAEARELIEQ